MMRRYRASAIPENAHPIVRRLFAEMRRQRVSPHSVSQRAGLGDKVVGSWRHHVPTLANLEAALNVLGLKLVVLSGDDE